MAYNMIKTPQFELPHFRFNIKPKAPSFPSEEK